MIRRLTCLPKLLTVNASNSFIKTLVLSPWDDLLLLSSLFMHLHLVLCFALFNMILFGCFSVLFILFFKLKKIEKSEKYKNNVCFVYFGTCVPWMTIEIKFSKLFIICSLDEHLYAQLSK